MRCVFTVLIVPICAIPLQMVDLNELMCSVEFKVFSGPASSDDGRVAAMRVPGGATISRKQIDDYTKYVSIYGAKGLAYIKLNEDGPASPIIKFLGDGVTQKSHRTHWRTNWRHYFLWCRQGQSG